MLPSFDEGFGIPAVEAMAAGVPVVVSRRGALPEVCGDAAVYVDPDDPRGMAAAIAELLADPERLEDLRQRGVARARQFSWTASAERLWQAYADARRSPEPTLMRIGVDARELGGRPTGVGRYLRELLVRWQADAGLRRPRTGACSRRAPTRTRGRRRRDAVPACRGSWCPVPAARSGNSAISRAPRAPPRLDVLFSPAYTAPLLVSMPSVVAQHDVSFAAHPEWYAWRHGLRLRWLARWSGRRAHTVLTLTQFSADRDRALPRGRAATHPGHSARRGLPRCRRPCRRRPAPPTPVVLFVGSIFERRHLPLLIEGVALARRTMPDLRLHVIGENRTEPRQDLEAMARACGAAEALQVRDYVPDAELEAAYASAGVFAFLSEYEGFGLTPLEAMRHRLPTVVLDTPVAREVYGAGARYVPAGDANAVAAALVELLRDPARRASQIAAGDAAVGRYRWHDAAAATWNALVAAGERRS